MVSSRPLLYLSLPGLALMLGVIWYRRRKTVHCDNTGGDEDNVTDENNVKGDNLKANNCTNRALKTSKSVEIMPNPKGNRDDENEGKYGKSAPIDILPNRKSSVYLTDKQIDTEILKIKIRDCENKTLRSIEESSESISPLSLPDSMHKRNYLSPRPKKTDQANEPVVIKATVNAKISPKNSFLESAYTEECPASRPTMDHVSGKAIEIVKDNSKVGNTTPEMEKKQESLSLKVEEGRSQTTTSSPPLSVCSLRSADSGKGSSLPHAEEHSIMTYEFLLPNSLVGVLYGRKRAHLNSLRAKAGSKIVLKKHHLSDKIKVCVIEGTQKEINNSLSLIRQRFPVKRYPNFTLERIHFAEPQAIVPLNEMHRSCLELSLIEGINNDIIVTSVTSGGHIFVQQPLHPSHPTLSILQNCLNTSYSDGEAPGLPELTDDAICVGQYLDSWYRVQIVNKTADQENACVVKFLDFGGYAVIEQDKLKQVRADFLVTPFQAIEAVLSNIEPTGTEWSTEAATVLYELTKGIVLQAQVVGYTGENIPEIYLYACLGHNNVIFINKELVARNLAKWTEIRD